LTESNQETADSIVLAVGRDETRRLGAEQAAMPDRASFPTKLAVTLAPRLESKLSVVLFPVSVTAPHVLEVANAPYSKSAPPVWVVGPTQLYAAIPNTATSPYAAVRRLHNISIE